MEKRAILAIVLSMAVLFGYQYFIGKVSPKPPVPVINVQETKANQQEKTAVKQDADKKPDKEVALPAKKPPVKHESLTIETDNYIAVINLASGRVTAWELKKYCTDKSVKEEVNGKQENKQIRVPVEFLKPDSGVESFKVLGINEDDISYTSSAKEAVFGSDGRFNLEFTATGKNKIKVKKIYSFSKDDYMVSLKLIFENLSGKQIEIKSPGVELVLDPSSIEEKQGLKYYHQVYLDNKAVRTDSKNFEKNSGFSGNIRWTAFSGICYTACIISPENFASHSSLKKDGNFAYTTLMLPDAPVKPSETFSCEFWLYMGATPYDLLKKYKVDLESLLHFGWFSSIGIWLLVTLNFFYRIVGNYGISIILLTILVKIILWIPTKKSFISMKKMQKLHPQMEALKARFKNNPQQLNQETLKLYKDNKINPLGGCLPMILQLPIFYALYMVLANSAELQGAPFYFWITDLSKMDKFYVLPILMGASMFIQQKMTPSMGDPAQAKIFMFLPIIMTFLFAGLPAGLLLYFVVQNVLQIIQQYFINKSTN